MKKSYVIPNMNIVIGTAHNMLATSANDIKTSANDIKKIFCSETRCPFNNEWCVDKQKRLDAWHKAVNYFAKNRSNVTFSTSANMFDGCPNGYKFLCGTYKQKQF